VHSRDAVIKVHSEDSTNLEEFDATEILRVPSFRISEKRPMFLLRFSVQFTLLVFFISRLYLAERNRPDFDVDWLTFRPEIDCENGPDFDLNSTSKFGRSIFAYFDQILTEFRVEILSKLGQKYFLQRVHRKYT